MRYDLHSEGFWEPENLRAEFLRVADVCCGCRLCGEICSSFPVLFGAVDDHHRGNSAALTEADIRRAIDRCVQCALCYIRCPYRPDRDERRAVDFPRLVLRERIVRAGREGMKLRDRLLGNPDLTGAIGGLTAPVSNWSLRCGPVRLLLEKLIGIDRERPFPRFHRTTFEQWFRRSEKRLRKKVGGTGGKVALLATCTINYHAPEIGRSAVAVLAHHDIRIVYPDQRCCGRPHLERGDWKGALENLRFNIRAMRRFVEEGFTIVTLRPSCSAMLRSEYPWLDGGPGSHAVSEATKDLGEYLMERKAEGRLDTRFRFRPAGILHHLACPRGAAGREDGSRELLRLIPNVEIEATDSVCAACCAGGLDDGLREGSLGPVRRLLERIDGSRADRIVADCAWAGSWIGEVTGRRASHPVEILREAYGLPLEP